MWYDATVASGLLEANNSAVKGKNGYVPAPVNKTKNAGWLWSWALAIPKVSSRKDLAWKYISFAAGPQYLQEAGSRISGGWSAIPPATRYSTYQIPQYKTAAAAFAGPTLAAISNAPLNDPGTTKRPGFPGVQYVGIPQFQDVGNQCTQLFSGVIAGTTSVDSALSGCQSVAAQVSK
jgi:sorbitol/mannitol transport system substrate-binding protein